MVLLSQPTFVPSGSVSGLVARPQDLIEAPAGPEEPGHAVRRGARRPSAMRCCSAQHVACDSESAVGASFFSSAPSGAAARGAAADESDTLTVRACETAGTS